MFEQKRATSPSALIRTLPGLVFVALLVACNADKEPAEKATANAKSVNVTSEHETVTDSLESDPGGASIQKAPAAAETKKPVRSDQPDSQNAHDLLQDLEAMAMEEGSDNSEQTSEVLQRLRLEGANALIPLRDALMEDDSFSDSFPELRLELLNVLLGLGVPEVEDVALQLLARGATAPEVLQLALYLEGIQPGKYSDSIRLAAEQTLINSDPSSIMSPEFFTLLGELGNEETAMVLAETPLHDEAYASFALASIPDGSGLRQLEQEARLFEIGRETPRGELAIQLLAQQAPAFPHAAATLIELAERGAIPNNSWPYILDIVAGNWKLTLFKPPADLLVGSHTYLSPQGNQVVYREALLLEQLDDDLQSQRLYLLERLQELAPPPSG